MVYKLDIQIQYIPILRYKIRNGEMSYGASILLGIIIGLARKGDSFCYASTEFLAQEMHCGKRSIFNFLKELENLGLIEKETVSVKGCITGRKIYLSDAFVNELNTNSTSAKNDTRTSAKNDTRDTNSTSAKNDTQVIEIYNTLLEDKDTLVDKDTREYLSKRDEYICSADCEEILKFLNQTRKSLGISTKAYARTKANMDLINKALEKFSKDDIIKVINHRKEQILTEKNPKKNETNRLYFRISTLMAVSNIDSNLQYLQKNKKVDMDDFWKRYEAPKRKRERKRG